MRHLVRSIWITVMLALTVTGYAHANTFTCDAGDIPCLITAINDANANGQPNTIRLAAGTYTLTSVDNNTNGANGLPSITGTLTIEAAGTDSAALTRLSTAPEFRLVHVGPSGHLTLRGIILSLGRARDVKGGEGLLNNGGVVTVTDSGFFHNGENSSGGALANNGGVVTITNSTFGSNAGGGGGAISNSGTLTIRRSTFDKNDGLEGGAILTSNGVVRITRSRFATNKAHFSGGAVVVRGGTVLLTRTSLVGNISDGAGAIRVESQGTLIVRNSAFVENEAVTSGSAAIQNGGTAEVANTTFARNISTVSSPAGGTDIAIRNIGRLSLINCTFAENTAKFASPNNSLLSGLTNATTILQNTILAHTGSGRTCTGAVTSLGNNLISDPTGCTIALQPGDLTGDAGLDAFADNGQPGNTHFPLLSTSQAIDAGNDDACPSKDQIGQSRKGQCDIGAIEFRSKSRRPKR
jgi:hypothetical protein